MLQNSSLKYEQPSIDVLDVRIESAILTGSNLENPSDGGEWEWDN